MPSIILFDVMSTLVYDPFYKEVPAFFGMSLKELFPLIRSDWWPRFEKAEIEESTFLTSLFADERKFDHVAFLKTIQDSYRWNEGIEELLQELLLAKVEMHTFSNYPIWYKMLEQELELSRYMPWTFTSWTSGLRKPEQKAYLHTVETLGGKPSDYLFIDDREDNCLAAESIGMFSHQYAGTPDLRSTLSYYGFLSS